MKRKKYDVSGQAQLEMNMTPMIDIVFNLIIFFMVVTELSKLDVIAGIQLPIADQAKVVQDPTDPVVVNLERGSDNMPILYFRNLRVSMEQLKQYLHVAAERDREQGDFPGIPPSNQEVIIRADKALQWQFVQEVMMECAHEGLWKVSLVAKPVKR